VLPFPLPDLAAGDEQQPVHAGERRHQGRRVVVVGHPNPHAPLGERSGLGIVADDGDHIGGGDAAIEQREHGEPAQLAGRTGNGIGSHGRFPFQRRGCRSLVRT
jgi:hypothetical protein